MFWAYLGLFALGYVFGWLRGFWVGKLRGKLEGKGIVMKQWLATMPNQDACSVCGSPAPMGSVLYRDGSLDGFNDDFEQAKDDLESVVADLEEEIQGVVAPKSFSLTLSEAFSDADESVFRLVASQNWRRDIVTVGSYRITLGGYPIAYGSFDDEEEDFSQEGSLTDRKDLEKHFAHMLGDKNSQLILFVAFLNRG